MIICNLLKFLFGICIVTKCAVFSLKSFGISKYDCVIETRELFNFLTPINHSVTILLSFSLLWTAIISSKAISFFIFCLDCILQYFYKCITYYLSIQ